MKTQDDNLRRPGRPVPRVGKRKQSVSAGDAGNGQRNTNTVAVCATLVPRLKAHVASRGTFVYKWVDAAIREKLSREGAR